MPETINFATTQLVTPTSAELTAIGQDLMDVLTMDDPLFKEMPVTEQDAWELDWEQEANTIGLQQPRGLDGQPSRVRKLGLNRYIMEPGVYGEQIDLSERELTTLRVPGSFGTPINITDIVLDKQNQLMTRRVNRLRYIGWKLLTTGVFAVSGPNGAVLHTDGFTLRPATASVAFSNLSTAAPLAFARTFKLLHRGTSASFGAGAHWYMSSTDVNNVLNNQNTNDLYGRRQNGLSSINNLGDLNNLLTGDNLPTIVEYDEGYIDDTGTFQLFITPGTSVLVGKRPLGQSVAEYRMARNVNNPDFAPGAYSKVIDTGDVSVPRHLEVHDGHNGGPVVFYPNAIVKISN